MPDPIRGVSTPDPVTPASTATGASGTAPAADNTATAAAASPAVAGTDQADVGQTEALLKTILDAASSTPGIDQAKVSELQQAIASGAYQVNPQSIAQKIVELEAQLGTAVRSFNDAVAAFPGSKPQRGEDRVGGGRLGLPLDPVLYKGEALGGLMDVVPLGDVGEASSNWSRHSARPNAGTVAGTVQGRYRPPDDSAARIDRTQSTVFLAPERLSSRLGSRSTGSPRPPSNPRESADHDAQIRFPREAQLDDNREIFNVASWRERCGRDLKSSFPIISETCV